METEDYKMSESCILELDTQLNECADLSKFNTYEDATYELFLQLYESISFYFEEKPVIMKHFPPTYTSRSGFYHLTCENYNHTGNEDDRVPNLRRYERIKWPRIIIENIQRDCPHLRVWKNKRHGKTNILILCVELKYVIVLSERKEGYLLLTTAYPIEYEHTLAKMLKEYEEYKKQKPLPT